MKQYNLIQAKERVFWIQEITLPKWYWPWKKVRTIPESECPYTGPIPFFDKREAEYRIKLLRKRYGR